MNVAETSPQLPPLASVAVALQHITERLAGDLASPQLAAPEWSEFEWRAARAVAAMHGIPGLLAGELPWHGPQGWSQFLNEQREHIARRQLRLHELLDNIAERCQRQGIPLQALKGAALHREELYQPGQRTMSDLDLLCSPHLVERVANVLETLGLRESHRTFKHRVFEPCDSNPPRAFGEHADNSLKVELHDRICEALPYRITDITSLVSAPEALPGLNSYPSHAALMAHLLFHAAGAMASRSLRLVQLHDIALLAPRLTQEDWRRLLTWRPWWAWAPLALAERYYGSLGPQSVKAALRSYCPAVLRRQSTRQRLTDVSLSRLWIEAFPGIEWTRSFGEAATYMLRRLVPNAEELADRSFALATDPSLATGDWGGLSQGGRILRVLRARTPRPWPLYNVRAAMAEPH